MIGRNPVVDIPFSKCLPPQAPDGSTFPADEDDEE